MLSDRMKKDIMNWLLSGNLVEDNDRIIIDEDSIVRTITGYKNSRPLLGFITLTLAILMCISLIVRYTVSYIEENLLYENTAVSTTEGALIHHQSLGRDYVLYMFNTASPWANTGIKLYKGDQIKNIGISGGFHSSVGHLISDTEGNNSKPSERLRSFEKKNSEKILTTDDEGKKEFLVAPTLPIGSAIYRVGNSNTLSLLNKKGEWENIKIDKDGILYLSVNDVNGNKLESYAEKFEERFVKGYNDTLKNLYFPKVFDVNNKLDSTERRIILDAYNKRYIDIRDLFYADNIGQVMFCAEIVHPLSWCSEKLAFRYIDSKLRQCKGMKEVSAFFIITGYFCVFLFWMAGLIALHLLIILIPMALIYMITQHPRFFYHRRKRSAMLSVLMLLLFPSFLNAQEYIPYLSVEEVPTSVVILPEPPGVGSDRFKLDSCIFVSAKALRDTDRGKQAVIDANVGGENILLLFSDAFGMPITLERTPMLAELLLRSKETFGDYATREAKQHHMRERPFMYFKEPSGTPNDDSWLITNGSYPSGHSAIYTGISLILAEINPDRQDEILLRGQDGAFSRVIVGAHWYSDIEAGKVVASATFARLHSDKAFNKQLKKAKREFCRAKKKHNSQKLQTGR